MANTYSQIYVQAVFAVQERANLIQPEWKEELFKYIAGIINNKRQKPIAIGGVADHIHVLFGIGPDFKVSELIRDVKANSSRFINQKGFVRGKFYWQEGFGAFSYSRSQIDTVAKYVMNQEKHHAKKSFKDEYLEFLNHFDVDYEEKYLFKWID